NSTDASGSFNFNTYGLGTFAINVTTTDADNDRANDALTSTASRTVTVGDDDITPPVILIGGSSGAENDGQDQHFTWNISDAGSDLASLDVTITRDDGTGPVVIYHTNNLADASGSFDFNSY